MEDILYIFPNILKFHNEKTICRKTIDWVFFFFSVVDPNPLSLAFFNSRYIETFILKFSPKFKRYDWY